MHKAWEGGKASPIGGWTIRIQMGLLTPPATRNRVFGQQACSRHKHSSLASQLGLFMPHMDLPYYIYLFARLYSTVHSVSSQLVLNFSLPAWDT
jgi:hypothetical protein